MLSLHREGSRGSEKAGLCHYSASQVWKGWWWSWRGAPQGRSELRNEGLVPVLALTLGDPASACL